MALCESQFNTVGVFCGKPNSQRMRRWWMMSLHVAVAATSSASADECATPVWLLDVEDIVTPLSCVAYPLVDLRVDMSRAQSLSVNPTRSTSGESFGFITNLKSRVW